MSPPRAAPSSVVTRCQARSEIETGVAVAVGLGIGTGEAGWVAVGMATGDGVTTADGAGLVVGADSGETVAALVQAAATITIRAMDPARRRIAALPARP